jgi:threonine dehydratase
MAQPTSFVGEAMTVSLEMIKAAQKRIAGAVYHSPCPYSLSLSKLCAAEIYCKLDHLQMTGSFKERGARNKLVQLSETQRKAGVIAASAGNHALGLAYHGQQLGIPVTVVMPKFAPLVKVSNCRSFGANVVMHGDSFDAAREHAMALGKQRGMTYVPGFDDADIVAGQGTVGLEILHDVPGVDAIIVPVGGAGLIAGIGAAVKAIRPEVKIIGVEPEHAPSLFESLKCGAVKPIVTKPTLADGLAVGRVGDVCFELCQKVVDRVVLVNEMAIAKGVLRLLELEKMVVEGAGAVGVSAMMEREKLGLKELEGKKVVLVLAGGNIDVTMISRVINRGLAGDGRLMRLIADVPDRPGGLARVLNLVADMGGSVQEVRHERQFGPADVALVRIFLIIETRDHAHIAQVKDGLKNAGVVVTEDDGI